MADSARAGLPGPTLAALAALALFAAAAATGAGPAGAEPPPPAAPPGEVRRVGELVLDGVPEIPPEVVDRMRQYQNVRSADLATWAPSEMGGLLVETRFGETSQLHHVRSPGAARTQITFFDEPPDGASFGADPGSFLFNRDWGGSEVSQIFRFDRRTGRAERLTDGVSLNGPPLWSNAGDRVVWRSTARNGADHDLWIMDPARPDGKRILLEVEGLWFPVDWSPDDTRILAVQYLSAAEATLWVIDVATGERRRVSGPARDGGEPVSEMEGAFDAKGEGVFFTTNAGTEQRRLRLAYPGGATTLLSLDRGELREDPRWDVGHLVMSRDRSRLAYTINEDGADRLRVIDTATLQVRAYDLPVGLMGNAEFSPDGRTLAFAFETPAAPRDVWTLDVETGVRTRWTDSEVGGLDTGAFRGGELFRYPTFDTDESGEPRTIPAYLYKPAGDGPFPVIIRIHGGPEGQYRPRFQYTNQYYPTELGLAVIFPNVRGSAGYGKTWLTLDDGRLREDSVKDIGALLDWIAGRPDLDETRVGVMGGSYGGYMTLATLVAYGDRVRCGVDNVGISNFVTFLENTSDYRRDLRRAEYGDERDPEMREFLRSISPLTHVDRIDTPLFVAQGANDPRVPRSEAEQIVAAVRAKGNPAWYLLAMDEGHGFRRKSNRDQYTFALSVFWERHLLGRGVGR